MNGNQQIAYYGLESVHGTEVVPSHAFGIVTGGSLLEQQEIYELYGLESFLPHTSEYGKVYRSGSIEQLLQSLTLLEYGFYRFNTGELQSLTIDAGSANGTFSRRFVGSKIENMTVQFSLDDPVSISYSWTAIKTKNGISASQSLISSPIWTMDGIVLLYNEVQIADLTGFTLEVNNRLTPVFLCNELSDDLRSPMYIKEGNREMTGTIRSFDRIAPMVREAIATHGTEGFEVEISLVDLCSEQTGTLLLSGSFQRESSEPLAPHQFVEFGTVFRPKTILIS